MEYLSLTVNILVINPFMQQILLQPAMCNEASHDASEKLVRQINIWATSGATFEPRHNDILSISSGASRGGPLFSYKERDPTRRQDQRSPAVTRERCRSVDPANGERNQSTTEGSLKRHCCAFQMKL